MDCHLEPYEKFRRDMSMTCYECKSDNVCCEYYYYYCSNCEQTYRRSMARNNTEHYMSCYNCDNNDTYGMIWGFYGNYTWDHCGGSKENRYEYMRYCKECFKHEYQVYTMGGNIKPAKRPRLQ